MSYKEFYNDSKYNTSVIEQRFYTTREILFGERNRMKTRQSGDK